MTPHGVSISVVAAEDDDDVFDGTSPYAADEGVANITIADDADSGEYTLTVNAEQGSGDKKVTKMTTVNVIVTGVLDHYAIDGPANIQTGTSEIFTVEAQDSLNNRAEFGSKQSMKVAVSVEGPGKDFVSLSGLTAGELDLGTSGMASFRVRAASDAVGSRITIVVTPVGSGVADITEATKDVVIGMASTGEDEMVELMMPTGVTPRTPSPEAVQSTCRGRLGRVLRDTSCCCSPPPPYTSTLSTSRTSTPGAIPSEAWRLATTTSSWRLTRAVCSSTTSSARM